MTARTPPQTDAQLVRQMTQQMRSAANRVTQRIGNWVIYEDDDGQLVTTKPGSTLDVGTAPVVLAIPDSTRGYVTALQVAQAVSGGKTSDLIGSTQNQVDKDTATSDAQYSADTANAVAAAIQAQLAAGSSGYLWQDSFDLPQDLTQCGPRYSRIYHAGSGNYGLDGNGNVASGGAVGTGTAVWVDLHDTPTTTDKQLLSTTTLYRPESNGGGGTSPSHTGLIGRWDGTMTGGVPTNAVYGWWQYNYAEVGVYKAGSYTKLSGASISGAGGDAMSFQVGTDADPYQLILLQNSVTAVGTNDAGHIHNVGAGYRMGGFLNYAGNTFNGTVYQLHPPGLQAFNFADRSVGF